MTPCMVMSMSTRSMTSAPIGLEDAVLEEGLADERMDDGNAETKAALALVAVHDGERAGRQPIRQREAPAPKRPEISGAAEMQRTRALAEAEPHADAPAHTFDQAFRVGCLLDGDARYGAPTRK